MTFQTQFRYVPPHASPRHWRDSNSLLSDNSCVEPPDPIPNSEVKRTCADGSVALPCESRSSLSIYTEGRSPNGTGLLLFEVRDAAACARVNPRVCQVVQAAEGSPPRSLPGYRTCGGSPPTMTTSAGRRAKSPTLTTPGIWLIACSSASGSVIASPWISRMTLPLSVTTP